MTFQYEFNESQNQLISDVAVKMRFVGYFLIAVGVLGALRGVIAFANGGLVFIIQGIATVVIGLWTKAAGDCFNNIVKTQGNDIENLMGALAELRKLYTLQYWLLVITLIFMAIVIVFFLIMMLTMRPFG